MFYLSIYLSTLFFCLFFFFLRVFSLLLFTLLINFQGIYTSVFSLTDRGSQALQVFSHFQSSSSPLPRISLLWVFLNTAEQSQPSALWNGICSSIFLMLISILIYPVVCLLLLVYLFISFILTIMSEGCQNYPINLQAFLISTAKTVHIPLVDDLALSYARFHLTSLASVHNFFFALCPGPFAYQWFFPAWCQ